MINIQISITYINIQRKSNVNHRYMKMICSNRMFPPLNVIIIKQYKYVVKGIKEIINICQIQNEVQTL